MNQTLLQSSFHLDYPSGSDDFISQDRSFEAGASSSTFPSDNVVDHGSSTSLEQSLASHPDALAANHHGSGIIRYSPNHSSSVHDASSFHGANGFHISPIDSSGESTSTSPGSAASSFAFSSLANVFPSNVTSTDAYPPTPVSVYSQAANYQQWNGAMSDYRPRVPALQPPPLGLSPSSQSQGTTHSSTPSLLGGPGRDIYQPSLHHPRIQFSAHPSIHDSRPPYAAPRAIENPATSMSSPNSLYTHSSMMLDPGRHEQTGPAAPPFEDTNVLHSIYSATRQQIHPDIHAKIHKGFFQVDRKWTCYRRNYFSVSCSFSLRPPQGSAQLFLQRPNGNGLECIQSFAVTIAAVVNGDTGEARALIQHTPKRSKETEEPPKKIRLNPIQQSSLGLNSNPNSGSMPFSFPSMPQSNGIKSEFDPSYSGTPGTQNTTSHIFERIQFQRATANNGKRRAQQQYYHVVVELYAEVPRSPDSPSPNLVKIATKLSAPMVVRGRSPGHYKDGRRDSSTSGMGGDGPTGPGDGSGGSILPPPLGGPGPIARFSLPQDPHGRGDYRTVPSDPYTNASPINSSASSVLEPESLDEEDGEAMDTSEVDKYMPDYPTTSETDLHSSPSDYRIRLPELPGLSRQPVDDSHPTFNFSTFTSHDPGARYQTPRPTDQYSRGEYTHGYDRHSHQPWLANGYHRDPINHGSSAWNGSPYARMETVNSA